MANYYLDVKNVSRGKGRSVTKLANYISGRTLRDGYKGVTYYRHRQDVLYCNIFQPVAAPPDFCELQRLCNEIDKAEVRRDARTAREFKGSLPNELPLQEQIRIVSEFIHINFVDQSLCAIAAIHEGKNVDDPSRNNPHVHIIVPTRPVGPDGFCLKKDREHDKRKYINAWREQWACVQNRAYERSGLDVRVSHECLEVQGVHDREPTVYLRLADWQREKRGERTRAGDLKRKVDARNKAWALQRQVERERVHEIELSR